MHARTSYPCRLTFQVPSPCTFLFMCFRSADHPTSFSRRRAKRGVVRFARRKSIHVETNAYGRFLFQTVEGFKKF